MRLRRAPTPSGGRAAPADEGGFTLVELVVTSAVVLTGVVATIGVFLGALDATADADNRVRASALATREVEAMQAVPYDQLGLDPSAPGYRSSFDGADTVAVSPAAVGPVGADEVIDGVAFGIRRDVVWAPVAGHTDAVKRVVATITWNDDSGAHEVAADAGVYPGGLGPYGGGATTTTAPASTVTPGAPSGLTATLSPFNPTSQVDLSWTANAPEGATWEIWHAVNLAILDWVQDTDSHPWGTTQLSVTGLSANTIYVFAVRAVAADGTPGPWSSWAIAATDASPTTCTILAATATPGSVEKKTNNRLQRSVLLQVSTAGSGCLGLKAVVPTQPGVNQTVVLSSNGATYTSSIGKNTIHDWSSWSTGNKSISVQDLLGTEVATISLLVTG